MNGAIAEDETRQGVIELVLARPASNQEAVWVRIRAGVLPRGTEIRVSTSDGVLLGTVSSFPTRRGREEPVAHTIPIPKTAIVNDCVRLRLEVEAPGKPIRAPRPSEIESINLIYVPISN